LVTESGLLAQLRRAEERIRGKETGVPGNVMEYAAFAQKKTWTQKWDPDARRAGEPHEVTGTVWSDAIERCLADHGGAFIPQMDEPVYLDRPIVLKTGDRLTVHPETEIRLIVGAVGTCIVRNAGIVFSQDRPVRMCEGADTDILIEGGIWSDQNNEGRGRGGAYDEADSMQGAHGAFLFHNVAGITVRNAHFRDCSAFAIQLGNARDFLLEGITFDETADGIHIEGPAELGIIRRVSGKTNDDVVALNAWDWDNSSLTFGPITDMLVEDVESAPGYTWSEVRLLAGTKVFPGGGRVDCDIRRCVFRDIRGMHTFKMYDQPNMFRPEADFADPIGRMADLFFSDIVVDGISRQTYYDPSSDGVFDICADVDGMTVRNVRFNYTPGQNDMAPYLVSVGPKALTWPRNRERDEGWFEVFNPNANPVVKGLQVQDVFVPDPHEAGRYTPCRDISALLHERTVYPNPDFPRTMPRGGTGRGTIAEPVTV